HHPRLCRRRYPGAERPLRTLRHRRQQERQDSEGHRSEVADAAGLPRVARERTGPAAPRQEGRRKEGSSGETGGDQEEGASEKEEKEIQRKEEKEEESGDEEKEIRRMKHLDVPAAFEVVRAG